MLLITNGTIVDPVQGIYKGDILIRDGKIAKIADKIEQTELKEECFMNCDAIVSIQFSDKLCSFQPSSLRNCKNLVEITIPSVTKCSVDIESLIEEIGHQIKIIINL